MTEETFNKAVELNSKLRRSRINLEILKNSADSPIQVSIAELNIVLMSGEHLRRILYDCLKDKIIKECDDLYEKFNAL